MTPTPLLPAIAGALVELGLVPPGLDAPGLANAAAVEVLVAIRQAGWIVTGDTDDRSTAELNALRLVEALVRDHLGGGPVTVPAEVLRTPEPRLRLDVDEERDELTVAVLPEEPRPALRLVTP